jgi:hypothetical protein
MKMATANGQENWKSQLDKQIGQENWTSELDKQIGQANGQANWTSKLDKQIPTVTFKDSYIQYSIIFIVQSP